MGLAEADDEVAMTFTLKPAKLAEANELMQQAIGARRSGNAALAASLERAAQAVVDDECNYTPTQVGLISSKNKSSEVTRLDTPVVSWSSFSVGSSRRTGATLSLPPAP
jgi:hypothetical protein